MPLAPGQQLGPYTIETLLGAGGMGEVYRANDARLGRPIALKVISAKIASDLSSSTRFEAEARAASALNHPAIVTIYDIGQTDGVQWIAMEWVEGRTLRAVLEPGPVAVREAWSIAKQVADGLAAAHAKGIVHRDLKPENVMVTADGRVKILDFGLARRNVADLADSTSGSTATMAPGPTFPGVVLGTVGYMSPEQASGRGVDFRSDQFAFGVLVYELLTGRRAFARPTAVETLAAIIRDEPSPLAALRPDASVALQHIVGRCLAKQADQRFDSTRDLAVALEMLVPEASPSDVTPVTDARSIPATDASSAASVERVRPTRRQRARAVLVLIALAIVLAAGIAWNPFGTPASGTIDTLAVLPFENAGDDPETEYLGDGLTESLIDHLSRVSALKVMARGTVMRFRGAGDPQQAGRSLNVGAVVTGSVSRRGNQVVISTELIATETGERLWGQVYDRPFAEIFRVQDSIVSSIAAGLRLRLSRQEKQQISGFGTDNLEAYELYLRGQYLMYRDTEEDDLEAQKLFMQAVEKDPKFVDAYLAISATHARRAGNGYAPPAEALARAAEAIATARALDPQNVAVRASDAGNRFQTSFNWEAAEREFRALLNEPALFRGAHYHPIALFFVARGRPDEAVTVMERALAVDPGNVESQVMLGNFLIQAGRLDEALNVYKRISEAESGDPRPHFGIADVYKRRGDAPRAIAARLKAYELAGYDEGVRAFAGATTEDDYEKADVALARLQLRELKQRANEVYVSPLDLARLHAQVGEREEAFAALQLALAEPPVGLTLLKVDQAWDPVRTDPRFAAIVKQLRIP